MESSVGSQRFLPCVFVCLVYFVVVLSTRATSVRLAVTTWGVRNCNYGVHATERVRGGGLGARVREPLAVGDEQVLVSAWRQNKLLEPAPFTHWDHRRGAGTPIVERPGNADGCGRRMIELHLHDVPAVTGVVSV